MFRQAEVINFYFIRYLEMRNKYLTLNVLPDIINV
nr:MAG TPA: hypothetical protein [Caudoviricetes sp.]